MGQIATTIDEQIQILKNRGMVFDCQEEKVKEQLLDIGYYRLGFYWFPFEVDKSHNFKEGTRFSDCVQLYYFDTDLRHLLVKYTNRIEINFRTKVVFEASNYYKEKPTWFINSEIINSSYISGFLKVYEKLKNDNKFIKKHHVKYHRHKVAPAWKTIEFLTFGSVFNLYKSMLNHDLKKKIALHYGLKKHYKLQNYLGVTLFIRNACAHGAVIYDIQTHKEIEKIPAIQFNNDDRHSLDSAIKVIHYLLTHISKNRADDFDVEFRELVDKNLKNNYLKSIVLKKMNTIL